MVRQWQKLFYENRFSHTTLEKPLLFSSGESGAAFSDDRIVPIRKR